MQRARQRTQKRGLAQPRHAFQKYVSTGKETDQDAFDDIVLADNDFGDFAANLIESVDCCLERRFGCHDIIVSWLAGLPSAGTVRPNSCASQVRISDRSSSALRALSAEKQRTHQYHTCMT